MIAVRAYPVHAGIGLGWVYYVAGFLSASFKSLLKTGPIDSLFPTQHAFNGDKALGDTALIQRIVALG